MSPMHPWLQDKPIYLDYNATTPVDPRVVDAMLPYLSKHFGNPSSTHFYGHTTHRAIQKAREQVAQLLRCAPDELVFTGCGSESDTLAIRGAALAFLTADLSAARRDSGVGWLHSRIYRDKGIHIITQVTEHPAVLRTCQALERWHGFRVTYLPVDKYGRVDPAQVEVAIDDETVLVTIMHANNETGTLQPVAEIAEIAHRHGALMHTDASQTVGKIAVDVAELGVDLLPVAGDRLYAPKGIGALYVRRGVQLEPAIYGGGQEAGRRAGTENTAFMVALGAVAALASEQLAAGQSHQQALRNQLHALLEQYLPATIHLNGHPVERLPNTLNVSIDGVVGEEVLAATPSVAASTGSACHEGRTEPSAVLMAMGLLRERQ